MGPKIYGAREASEFYFNKDVSQLNASECIFLASVIPSPRKFYYRFDKEGNLAPFMIDYYRQMTERMAKRGLIPHDNPDSLISLLKITGPAKSYLGNAIQPIDSTMFAPGNADIE